MVAMRQHIFLYIKLAKKMISVATGQQSTYFPLKINKRYDFRKNLNVSYLRAR